jgi:hypothetical protein
VCGARSIGEGIAPDASVSFVRACGIAETAPAPRAVGSALLEVIPQADARSGSRGVGVEWLAVLTISSSSTASTPCATGPPNPGADALALRAVLWRRYHRPAHLSGAAALAKTRGAQRLGSLQPAEPEVLR